MTAPPLVRLLYEKAEHYLRVRGREQEPTLEQPPAPAQVEQHLILI